MYSRIGKFSNICLRSVYNSAREASVLSHPFAFASKVLDKKAMYPYSAFPPSGRIHLPPPPGTGTGRFSGYEEFDDGYGEGGPIHKVTCGDLRECHVGMEVELSGRVQYQRLGRFLTLRDQHGTTQVVAPDERPDISRRLSNMPIDSYVAIRGWVCQRPPGQRNVRMPTGGIEVIIKEFRMVQPAKKSYSTKDDAPRKSGKTSTASHHNRITSEEFAKCVSPSVTSRFARRTHTCGDLSEDRIGEQVHLCGWVELKRMGRFITLRDGYGFAQIVAPSNHPELSRLMSEVKLDTVVTVKGLVCARPPGQKNARMQTGAIEISVTDFEIVDPDEKVEESDHKQESDSAMTDLNSSVDNRNSMECSKPAPVPETNKFTHRTHTCGELREGHVGQKVKLVGWVEFQRMGKFVTLRDAYGATQLVAPDDRKDIIELLETVPYESVVSAEGVVCSRPPAQENLKMPTGAVEVVLSDFKLVNPAKKQLPFNVRDFSKAKEPLRMKYRYLDLRFPEMQHNLRLRSKVLMKMRDYLCNYCDFVEVETPTLFRKTPGGAQEFVVPTQLKGKFYSLVQSPQQFKQLLMVGSVDRYFQIARCYRDEGARPDRQPEFTQLDIELSFSDREGILSLVESLLHFSWPKELDPITVPFPRMTYKEAMEQYGTDKPDIRFEMKLKDVTDIVQKSDTALVNSKKDLQDFTAQTFIVPKGAVHFTTGVKGKYEDMAKKEFPAASLIINKVSSIDDWEKALLKTFSKEAVNGLKEALQVEMFDLTMLAVGKKEEVLSLLGKLRVEYTDLLESKGVKHHRTKGHSFLWVLDFPMFVPGEKPGSIESAHHPFTQVHPDDVHLLQQEPLKAVHSSPSSAKVKTWLMMGWNEQPETGSWYCQLGFARSLHYDLVLNGCEIGGGSIRIHNPDTQMYVLKDVLGLDPASLQHLIDALQSGCPPHGGIALGVDRLLAEMCSASSIRDVIAFPKATDGKDLMSDAPVTISAEEKKLYHIEVMDEDNKTG